MSQIVCRLVNGRRVLGPIAPCHREQKQTYSETFTLFVFFFAHERNERGLAESVDGMESPDKSFWISSFASPIDIAIIGQALWDDLRNR